MVQTKILVFDNDLTVNGKHAKVVTDLIVTVLFDGISLSNVNNSKLK